ncbi:MAG: acyl-CoA desaturase [Chloroflexi bacterium]|nr:acyl-CoA desaturase [Chloroflexota bacterium]
MTTRNGVPAPSGGASVPDALRQDALQYAELRRLIKKEGLLDKQPAYYLYKVPLTLALLAASLAILVIVGNSWLQLVNAAFMAFAFTQLGLLGHDATHYQIFSSKRRNDLLSLLVGFLMSMVPSWWKDKHNAKHHRKPNQIGEDSDIDVSVLAFNESTALDKTGLHRFIVRNQAYLFYPVLFLASLSFLFAGIHHLLTSGKVRYPIVEPLAVGAHLAVYFALLFILLDPGLAVLFFVVHHGLTGLYMGSVFAPNHKGMPVLEKGEQMGFMTQQIITTRNLYPNPITNFVYGGLNYHIEHHLFPNMPRNNLKKAHKVVKEFCRTHGLPYYETGVLQSQREILAYLHKVSAPLRTRTV